MPELNTAMITTPDRVVIEDMPLQMARYWMLKAVKKMALQGLQLTHLDRDEAVKIRVRNILNTADPLLFWGMGHGCEVYFTGQLRSKDVHDLNEWIILCTITASFEMDGEVFETTANPDWMEGRVVHLTSCMTTELGTALVNAGALAYIGYSWLFVVGVYEGYPEDRYTQSYMEPDIQIELTLLAGKSVGEAEQASYFKSDEWIEYWRRSGDPNSDTMIKGMISNKTGLTILGDRTVKIRFVPDAISPWHVVGAWTTAGTVGLGAIGVVSGEEEAGEFGLRTARRMMSYAR